MHHHLGRPKGCLSMSQLVLTPKDFWVPDPAKVGRSRFLSWKNMILGLILGRKPWFHQFWPHLTLPPHTLPYMVGNLWISASIWHQAIEIWRILPAVRILRTHPDRFLNSSWHCVINTRAPNGANKLKRYNNSFLRALPLPLSVSFRFLELQRPRRLFLHLFYNSWNIFNNIGNACKDLLSF